MAKGLWKKALNAIGVNQEEEENEFFEEDMYEESYVEEEEELDYHEPKFNRNRRAKVIEMPDTSGRLSMIIYKPSTMEETQAIIDNLKSRRPVIVNLDDLDVDVAQRILDFISGAVYAIGGEVRKAARNLFVVAPSNVDISTNVAEEEPTSFVGYM